MDYTGEGKDLLPLRINKHLLIFQNETPVKQSTANLVMWKCLVIGRGGSELLDDGEVGSDQISSHQQGVPPAAHHHHWTPPQCVLTVIYLRNNEERILRKDNALRYPCENVNKYRTPEAIQSPSKLLQFHQGTLPRHFSHPFLGTYEVVQFLDLGYLKGTHSGGWYTVPYLFHGILG